MFDGYLLPTFYIASQSHSDGVSHIECYDCCKNLDIPFDYSGYEQFEKKADGSDDVSSPRWYATSQVLGDIAAQCGFAASSPSASRLPQMCYLDFKGKSCRQILEDVSKVQVGWWITSGDNCLVFVPFSPHKTGFEIAENDRSEIRLKGSKTITGIVAEDEIYGGIYNSGSGWKNSERISGRYITEDKAASMVSQILGDGGSYEYNGGNALPLSFLLRITLVTVLLTAASCCLFWTSHAILPISALLRLCLLLRLILRFLNIRICIPDSLTGR